MRTKRRHWIAVIILATGCVLVNSPPQQNAAAAFADSSAVQFRTLVTATPPRRRDQSSTRTAIKTPPAVDAAPTLQPSSGTLIVTVELMDAPLAAILKQVQAEGFSVSGIARVVRHFNRQIRAQQAIVERLTDPSINAKVIASAWITTNSITISVDADKLPLIRSLPGVKAVHTGTLQERNSAVETPGGVNE